MKNLFSKQGIASVLPKRFVRTTALPLCLLVLSALRAAPAYADDPQIVYSKHQDLRHEGSLVGAKQDIRGLDFESKKWTYCIIRLNGYYQKDWTHRPSQKFCVWLNGRKVFDEQLKGERVLEIPLDGADQRIEVTGYMQCVNAATHMAGKVTVDCFLESPGAFYVTQVHYDKDRAVRLNDEFISADSKVIYNKSDLPVTEKFSLSWTESKTLSWQKSFEHAEKIGISIGYRAASSGGFEVMADFDVQFRTAYQTGSAEVKSKTLTYESSVLVPPHKHHEIYAEKTKTAYRMPYYLEGYVVNGDGSKTYKKLQDQCFLTYISKVTMKHKDLDGGNREPVTLKVLERKNPFGK